MHKPDPPHITVVGGGFAGVEAAWAAASRGAHVTLYEMRPVQSTAVHLTDSLAELVCSNSFKSNLLTNASGVMKEEMRRLGSLTVEVAPRHAVPAGEALAVDREAFAAEITQRIQAHPAINLVRQEVTELPAGRPLIIASGPLTSPPLAAVLQTIAGDALAFYDAVAPTITLESIDVSRVYRASRRGRGSQNPESQPGPGCAAEPEPSADYLNCPLNREEYGIFHAALVAAEQARPHNPEELATPFFEMCVPVEELARRGERTLAFGAMKPVGLIDPRTGKRPWAVLQLRQENREGTLWGMVGFQTRLKFGEQRSVFRLIPGLENAEFVRYGVMHRNTYVNSPRVLNPWLELREHPGILLAGQITGVEGYLESAAVGMLAGISAVRIAAGQPPAIPPRVSILGSLCAWLTETDPAHFSPMNSNFGIVPELETPVRDKREKGRLKGVRALAAIDEYVNRLDPQSV